MGIRECPSSVHLAQTLDTVPVEDRCDDLESLGYMLLYFLPGSLRWQGLTAKDQVQKKDLILEKKETISSESLCRGLPRGFRLILTIFVP